MERTREDFLATNLDVFCRDFSSERRPLDNPSKFIHAINAISRQAAHKRIAPDQVVAWLGDPDQDEAAGDFRFLKYLYEYGPYLNAVVGEVVFTVYDNRIIPEPPEEM